ncbi:ribosome maturation factor RimP [Halocella sp. SP3-1]|uniref:ribosome maturation factor RimP n=1 Tax=Halocella sp. SP3-1 TaxID=2382161 RepID=UPI000F761937|nr:ribosome maturation factor RimP [Halocella sp. SP3-1]AZO95543.1 ribosome maturation factor RimP [Halocella sp. SP3-1]
MGKVIETVRGYVEDIIKGKNLELVDVEYLKEGNNWYLRVFIERLDDQVTLEECEDISRILSDILDEKDPIENSYILEVSTPGLERPLKKRSDFDRFVGKLVTIKTYVPVEGKKVITGYIKGSDEENIMLDLKEGEGDVNIPFDKIAGANLTADFDLHTTK